MDKWLKRLWLVNGIALLILFAGALAEQIESWIPRKRPAASGPIVGGQLEKAKLDTLALQDIVSTVPRRIGNTNYCYISLVAKDLTKPARMRKYSDESSILQYCYVERQEDEVILLAHDEAINLIFLSDDGSDVRLLLKEKGAIVSTDIPSSDDTVQSFNLYQIVFHDTDSDGRLTSEDRSVLYISDLDGRGLRPLTPDSVDAKRIVRSLLENKVYIVGRIRSNDPKVPGSDWAQIVYQYDMRTQKLSPVLPDDRLMNEARRILQTK